jgi:hypothetical protein
MRRVLPWIWAAGWAIPVPAQVTTLDEGSFTLFVNGGRVGFEQFTIQRRAERTGATILAYATIQVDDRRIIPALSADTNGVPLTYKVEERRDGAVLQRLDAVSAGTIVTLTSITPRGRSERNLRLSSQTGLLDENVAHQYYFLARRGPGQHRVLVARHLAYDTVTVSVVDTGTVETGNGSVAARHLTVTTTTGTTTDVWVDAAGRVLRVSVPARGFVALRDEPPR